VRTGNEIVHDLHRSLTKTTEPKLPGNNQMIVRNWPHAHLACHINKNLCQILISEAASLFSAIGSVGYNRIIISNAICLHEMANIPSFRRFFSNLVYTGNGSSAHSK
jgi:hypothetical protein